MFTFIGLSVSAVFAFAEVCIFPDLLCEIFPPLCDKCFDPGDGMGSGLSF